MRSRASVALVTVVLLLAGACSSGDDSPTSPAGLITALPQRCGGLGAVPGRGQVTFVKGGRLIASRANGHRVRCVGDGLDATGIAWGGTGDRFLAAGESGADVYFASDHKSISPPSSDALVQGLSRPEGTQVVYVADGGDKLVKVPAEGGPPDDISFLARHDEAVYHPAGTHVAVVGEDGAGNYGIFLATNEGKDVEQLVSVKAAQEVYEPAFSHDGGTMYYVADHGGYWDLHEFSLSSRQPSAVTESALGTVAEYHKKIDTVRVSEFSDDLVAFRVGDCESGFRTYIDNQGETYLATTGLGDTTPVGWLPDDTLIVASSDDPCDEGAGTDLYAAGLNDQDLIVADVGGASIRAALPPPPDPPERAPDVIA